MIILKLKTPFDPGMYDAGNTYPHVLITGFNMAVLEAIIEIRWEYGTLSQSGWTSGKAGLPQQTVLQNDDFYSAIATMPASGSSDSILMAVARECYDILATTGAAPGDVVSVDLSTPEPAAPGVTATTSDSAAPATSTSTASSTSTPSGSSATSSSST
jgi:hypothetical protein